MWFEPEPVDGHVRGRVVAEHNHQRESIAEREGDGRREFAEHPGTLDLVRLGQHQPLRQRSVARADLLRRVKQDSHLDHRGSLYRQVGIEATRFARSSGSVRREHMAVMGPRQ